MLLNRHSEQRGAHDPASLRLALPAVAALAENTDAALLGVPHDGGTTYQPGLSSLGRFNPIKSHRHRRTLRRHLPLIDLLFHAVASHPAWMPAR